jgi:hypothetical protein
MVMALIHSLGQSSYSPTIVKGPLLLTLFVALGIWVPTHPLWGLIETTARALGRTPPVAQTPHPVWAWAAHFSSKSCFLQLS